MKRLVCQAQHLELNPLLYGQPMKLGKDWGDYTAGKVPPCDRHSKSLFCLATIATSCEMCH